MKISIEDFIEAARVPETLAEQAFGLWTIERHHHEGHIAKVIGWPTQTILYRVSDATMHLPPGEIVMEDSRRELSRHMAIWLAATGRVLVTGLGLGCAVRGLLINPLVERIDVVEVDPQIAARVGSEFAFHPRVRIHIADARDWPIPDGTRWDFAWHDIHSMEEADGHLAVLHAELIKRFIPYVASRQGAWQFPREIRKRMRTDKILHAGGGR